MFFLTQPQKPHLIISHSRSTLPAAIKWIQWLSFIRYGFEVLTSSQLAGETFTCAPGVESCPTGDQFLSLQGFSSSDTAFCIGMLYAFMVFYLALAWLSLTVKRPGGGK